MWTSGTILELQRMPERLLILGGGYVGCEFASMFAIFGSHVTLLQGPDQLLPREDADIDAAVSEVLTTQGVDVRVGVRATEVRRDAATGEVVVLLDDGSSVRGEELLAATGRSPVTSELALDTTGVELTDRGFVVVDDHLRATADYVWAAGDVAGSPQARSSRPFRWRCSVDFSMRPYGTPSSRTPAWPRG